MHRGRRLLLLYKQARDTNAREILLSWRKRLFYRVYTAFLFLITVPFIVSLKTGIEQGNWFLLVLHSVAYAIAVLVVTVRRIPYRIASAAGLLSIFIVSVSSATVQHAL